MTPSLHYAQVGENQTFIYVRVYEKPNGKITTYTGITCNMKNRQMNHSLNKTRTTNRFKEFRLKEIRFKEIKNLRYEYTFKKYGVEKKMNVIKNWSEFPDPTVGRDRDD